MDLREILGYNIIMADLRVLIVAANPLARSGLAVLVAGITGMKIVGATGVAEAASLAGQLLPDTVLLDAGDGEAEDLDVIARLATAQPGLPIGALARGSRRSGDRARLDPRVELLSPSPVTAGFEAGRLQSHRRSRIGGRSGSARGS